MHPSRRPRASPAATYYSPAMQAARPRSSRRRPRRGSFERPVNTRLIRAAALVVLPPLLLAAFTVLRPGPLPAGPLPPSFDASAALALTRELVTEHATRVPGTPQADRAARWFTDKLALYGLPVEADRWQARVPDLGLARLANIAVVVEGATPETIIFLAHRDTTPAGPGASDNASGTAMLVALARAYSVGGTTGGRARPQHTLVFLSTDGGAYGGVGAKRFASSSRFGKRTLAVVVLDALAGPAEPRLELAGDRPHSPAPALVRTASVRLAEQTGREPRQPSVLQQLVDLGLPFAYGEQAPFLARGISALRLTTSDDSGRSEVLDEPERLDEQRFAEVGRGAETLLGSLDGGAELAQDTSAYVALGDRFVRGWAIALVLLAAIVPFLAGAFDLLARCLRRRLPLMPALRSLRSRIGVWLWALVALWLAAATGVLPSGEARPLPPAGASATDWPVASVTVLGLVATAGWWLARPRLQPRRSASAEEELAGYAIALAGLGFVAVATAVMSPFALVFVLPSLYTWLWLPHVQTTGRSWVMDVLFGLGLAGPVLALVSLESRFDLGIDVFLYAVGLVSVGYLSWTSVLLVLLWAAVATQVGALAAGRYAAYAGGVSDPPRGIIRNGVRRLFVAVQSRRRYRTGEPDASSPSPRET
jgi:peptidase M28-like protein